MISIVNLGMNHETAPVDLRECLASDPSGSVRALAAMKNFPSIRECLFLSTCNRVEAMAVTEEPEKTRDATLQILCELGGRSREQLAPSIYFYKDAEAVKHLFRVTSSLDSMVVGEPQILGQVKQAYAMAVREKTSGVIMNRLMHRAFRVAKRVRTETGISESAVSISYAAVELSRKIFHVLEGKEVLLIGAGEMAELAARHLVTHGVSGITVANRTFARGLAMAQLFGGRAISFEELGENLISADIVIASTGSPEPIITYDKVKGCLRKRKNRPLFFIDIAVPRDIDPEVNKLPNVYVYDIDDLKGVVEYNITQRKQESVKAERIVQEEVEKFFKWIDTLSAVPTIVELRNKADSVLANELKKSSSVLGSMTETQREAIITMAKSIADKMINDPIVFLKRTATRTSSHTYLDITRKLFNLDPDRDDLPFGKQ
ncbi:MAG: glutamyl-tRNA reductase [Desulfobacteraceae bacterium]|jgi:glutamyl-tRNA reductase|nr:MAG: glutamyl-tRNA reductase [Desulfobacteraceae bacterium]